MLTHMLIGKVRAIGVSNFAEKNLLKLLETAKIVPATNQMECHPSLPLYGLKELCDKHGILIVAYSPLGIDSTICLLCVYANMRSRSATARCWAGTLLSRPIHHTRCRTHQVISCDCHILVACPARYCGHT
jgi:diketogulonate reductase-like aldo/keto reductase